MASDGSVTIEVTLTKDQLEKGLKSLKSTINSALPNASKTLSTFANGFSKIGELATGVGKKISIVTTGLTGLATYAVKVGASFESQMSKVSAISGAVGDELKALREKAKEMGSITKFSATEAGQAFEYMAMAGWKTEDMLNGVEGIMNLAAASGEDLANTSDIVTDALTAFGLSAKDSSHFADVLAKASSSSNTNVSLLGETFKYVAPLAGALKYSVEDTAVAIGLMANAEIKGGQAGTALRAMLTRLVDPPKEAAQSLNRLGFSIKDTSGNIKPLNTVLVELRDKFDKLSGTQKVEMASSIAGQEAMSGLLAIVNASDADFENLTNQINNADGAAKQMADTMNNNLKGAVTLFKSNLESVGISIYDNFETPLKELVKSASALLTKLNPVFKGIFGEISPLIDKCTNSIKILTEKLGSMSTEELEKLGSTIFKLASAGPILLGVGAGANTLSDAFKGLSSGASVLEKITGSIPSLSTMKTAFSNMGKSMRSTGESSKKLFGTINSGFKTMLDGSIISKGLGNISNMFFNFGDKIATSLTSFGKVFSNFGGKIVKLLPFDFSTMFGSLQIIVAAGMTKISTMFNAIAPNFSAGLSKITGAFGGAFSGILKKTGQFLAVFSKMFNIAAIIGLVVVGLGLLQGQFGEKINEIATMMIEQGPTIIGNLVNGIVTAIPQLIQQGSQLLQTFLNVLIANLPVIIQGGIQIISSLVTGLSQQLPTLIPMALQLLTTVVTAIIQNLPLIIEAGIQLLVNLIQGIVDAIPQLIAMLPTIITTVCDIITQQLPNIINAGITILIALIEGLVNAIPQLVDMLPTIITTIINVITQNLPVIIDAGIKILITLINGLIQAIPQLIRMLPTIITTIVQVLAQNMPAILEAGR